MSLDLKSIEIRKNWEGVMEGKVYFADSDVSLSLTLTEADIAAVTGLVATRLVESAQQFAAQMVEHLKSGAAKTA